MRRRERERESLRKRERRRGSERELLGKSQKAALFFGTCVCVRVFVRGRVSLRAYGKLSVHISFES